MVKATALFQRQARLGPAERLYLALFAGGKHNGVSRRIGIKAYGAAQLADEVRIVGQLELPDAVWLQAMGAPDALNRADRNAGSLGHQCAGPVRCLAGRFIERQGGDPRGGFITQGLDARRPGLAAQKAVKTLLRKAFLPAPDAGLRLVRLAHDLVRSQPPRR